MIAGLLRRSDKGYHAPSPPARAYRWRSRFAEAFRHKGFWLLGVGYFACGLSVVFIGHALSRRSSMDQGLTVRDGHDFASAIGLFNISVPTSRGSLGRPVLEDLSALRRLCRAAGSLSHC